MDFSKRITICHFSKLPMTRSAKDILICAELSHFFLNFADSRDNLIMQTKKTESLRLLTKRSSASSENIADSLEITKSQLSSRLVVWEILLMPGKLSLRTSPHKWGRGQRSHRSRKRRLVSHMALLMCFVMSMFNLDFWLTSVFFHASVQIRTSTMCHILYRVKIFFIE